MRIPLQFPFAARVLAAAILALPAAAHSQTPLRVVRVTPAANGDASPLAQISVSFDRPVAGSLDQSVDPATVFHIEPAVGGRLEWRDPVTIRLTPSAPLSPDARYTVTVANTFKAMDGSSLSTPYEFSFRARGPQLLTGSPLSYGITAQHLQTNQRFTVVYSSPVDLTTIGSAAYIELSASCGGETIVRLDAISQRAIRNDDQSAFREAGGWDRDRSLDSLRRVVVLVPRSAIPRACRGELVVPHEITPTGARTSTRWSFATYGDLRILSLQCALYDLPQLRMPCPTGPLTLTFSNPVKGSEVVKRVKLIPETQFTIRDTSGESMQWTLEATLKPRLTYAAVADTAIKDIFGQSLRGNPAVAFATTGYSPTIVHATGKLLVERVGFRTLAVQHVNVDTLVATIASVPDSLATLLLNRYSLPPDSIWPRLRPWTTVQKFPVRAGVPLDHALITGIPLPIPGAGRGASTLLAVNVSGRGRSGSTPPNSAPTILQVTDLGVHAKIGATDGSVWVTGVSDGLARANVDVALHDPAGRVLASARTDAQGLARFASFRASSQSDQKSDDDEEGGYSDFEGFVTAQLGDDQAVTAINTFDPDLSPWRFNASPAWGDDRLPLAGAVFTERGIYRPTETVYAKAIVRNGLLGALRAPTAGDSIKWIFNDRDDGVLREVTVPLSTFGTSDQALEIRNGAAVGYYSISVKVKRLGTWRTVAQTGYRVAEYRPPEFLVDVNSADSTAAPGKTFTATLSARYLFGAPMGRAAVWWQARITSLSPWEINIPGMDGWSIGVTSNWWEDSQGEPTRAFDSKTDTLDVRGEGAYVVTVPDPANGRPARVTLDATVIDVNRQAVGASVSTIVFPAAFSIAAKPLGTDYFWRVGSAQNVAVLAVRPDGKKVAGVAIQGTVVRREWHRVRLERDGISQLVGEWVSDTLSRCNLTSADTATVCTIMPKAGGIISVTFKATDPSGRVATTSFQRWATGAGWVPWSDETQFKMDVIPDRARYSVGDTATVLFASPFTNADAWVTVEREGLISQRRIRITSGSTTLKFPITEAFAPNAYVSILVARGRSAPPGSLDDDGRPTIRVGYAELRVTPEVKRLAVTVEPIQAVYRPGDSARVAVRVLDAAHRGVRSEVTLWAVDRGVLALTGYKTPDPLDLIYRERGLGLRLASNMVSVAPQIPEGEKGRREAGGGGGAAGAEVLRSRFKTTAFFLGSVVTDANGNATAVAKLPDNLTTFQVMAVAVTAGDRFGKGESSILVTRPLLARQALPRFIREGDTFTAGAVINRRDGAAVPVTVKAASTGVTLRGDAEKKTTLEASRGSEVRFPFQSTRGDSATFRFDVTDGTNADAVQVKIPIRPDHHPVAHTIAGALRDTASVEFALASNIDPARSQLTLSLGSSPLAAIRGMNRTLRVYPYYCTEQVVSTALPILAMNRLERIAGAGRRTSDAGRSDIDRAVAMLSARQRTDGGIGYWSASDWTSPWLTAYAGVVLLEARAAGASVDSVVLWRVASYLTQSLHEAPTNAFSLVAFWNTRRDVQLRNQVAAVDFMSRFGHADIAAENELVRNAAQLSFEDRGRLAEVLMRRQQTAAARQLMEAMWARIAVEGRQALIPDSLRIPFYFASLVSPYARALTATLAVDPNHALVGPLTEALLQQGRVQGRWYWTTQDYGAAATALAALEARRQTTGPRSIRVSSGNRVLLEGGSADARDSSIALRGLLTRETNQQTLKLSLAAGPGEGAAYYYLTVTEIPSTQPVTPEDHGIRVERWYENYETGRPITRVNEGELVRVRLRLTVPTQRTFVVLDDALPAGLEAVDLSLRTVAKLPGPGVETPQDEDSENSWGWYGSWDSGWWSPFDHREMRDDRVVYSATMLWAGTYTASYVARATTAGTFIKAPAHAEEMYNPAVYGRSDGGTFVVTPRGQ